MVPPRQRDEFRGPAENEVGQRAARQVGRTDAITDVATRPREPGAIVEAHGCPPITSYAYRPTPGVCERHVVQSREQFDQRAPQVSKNTPVPVEPCFSSGAEVVRRAPPTEGEPTVRCALTVDDQVTVVGERLSIPEADLVPLRLRKRFSRNHQ